MTDDPHRDPVTGKFVAGNLANPKGRPPLSKERKEQLKMFMSVLNNQLDEKNITQIVKKAISQAKLGNRYARDWLFNYFAGSPAVVMELIHSGEVKTDIKINNYEEMLAKVYGDQETDN